MTRALAIFAALALIAVPTFAQSRAGSPTDPAGLATSH
ncbi:hypothetical protein METEAL_07080 [Mesoterricola silvestris]|uniref:Uncharacterized protein n=1 Tax=Mesoterricola silvestris TaxID=2927979 RepID=A0AA48GKQ3_9BACT|nr:hypothetical protein METEAL_07080 [Mesoterricola silvestris]